MTTMVGTVSPFDGTSQLWDEYIEYFFQANGIEGADKKKAVLLLLKDIVCYRCKGQHAPEECKFLNEL